MANVTVTATGQRAKRAFDLRRAVETAAEAFAQARELAVLSAGTGMQQMAKDAEADTWDVLSKALDLLEDAASAE